MYILTDGKNYVMENPLAHGNYIQTTYSVKAKEFTYKQAKSLLQAKKKSLSWIKNFYLVNKETGEVDKTAKFKKGNGGIYIGDNNVDFNDSIID